MCNTIKFLVTGLRSFFEPNCTIELPPPLFITRSYSRLIIRPYTRNTVTNFIIRRPNKVKTFTKDWFTNDATLNWLVAEVVLSASEDAELHVVTLVKQQLKLSTAMAAQVAEVGCTKWTFHVVASGTSLDKYLKWNRPEVNNFALQR